MSDLPLSVLQQRFRAVLNSESVAGAPADWVGVRESPPISVAERLEVYRFAYWARLEDILDGLFPRLHKALGCDEFLDLIRRFLLARPSSYGNPVEIGAELSPYLAETKAETPWPELAALEWAMSLAEWAVEPPAFDIARLQTLSGPEIDATVLELHPSFHLFRFDWEVDRIRGPRSPRKKGVSRVGVWRQRGKERIVVRRLPARQVGLLEEIKKGASFGELGPWLKRARVSQPTAFRWFSSWVSDGVFGSFRLKK